MVPFELLLHEDAIASLKKVRGANRRSITGFLERLIADPYQPADNTYYDLKGRVVFKRLIGRYIVDYSVDDPVKEIKVLRIVRLP